MKSQGSEERARGINWRKNGRFWEAGVSESSRAKILHLVSAKVMFGVSKATNGVLVSLNCNSVLTVVPDFVVHNSWICIQIACSREEIQL